MAQHAPSFLPIPQTPAQDVSFTGSTLNTDGLQICNYSSILPIFLSFIQNNVH